MTIILDKAELLLARHLRREREARNWSQTELERASGVSKAAISKIERGEMSPTASTLVRLANAFGLTLAGLLLQAEQRDDLQRSQDQPCWRDPEAGYLRQQVFMQPGHPVELVRVELPPGARVRLPASSYARIRQVVWMLSGMLSLSEGPQGYDLHPGDSLGFGPPAEVEFHNATSSPCTYLVALARE